MTSRSLPTYFTTSTFSTFCISCIPCCKFIFNSYTVLFWLLCAFAAGVGACVLFWEGINIQVISTSEIKVSVLIAEEYVELAVRALHSAYELDAA